MGIDGTSLFFGKWRLVNVLSVPRFTQLPNIVLGVQELCFGYRRKVQCWKAIWTVPMRLGLWAGGPLLVESITLERIAHFQSWGGPCLPGVGKRGTPLNVQNLPLSLVEMVGPASRNPRDTGHPKGFTFLFGCGLPVGDGGSFLAMLTQEMSGLPVLRRVPDVQNFNRIILDAVSDDMRQAPLQ